MMATAMSKAHPPALIWSVRRLRVYRACLRKYYFTYYGGRFGDSPRAREIRSLQRVRTRAEWAHARLRDALARAVREDANDVDKVAQSLLETLREDYRASRADEPGVLRLFDHAYALNTPAEVWRQAAEEAVACLRINLGAPFVKALPEATSSARLPEIEPPRLVLDGLAVSAPYAAAWVRETGPIVFDWAPEHDALNELLQACWALAAPSFWARDAEHVTGATLRIGDGVLRERRFEVEALDAVRETIFETADEMLFPLQETGDAGDALEEAFSCAENDTPCKTCAFLRVCPRWA